MGIIRPRAIKYIAPSGGGGGGGWSSADLFYTDFSSGAPAQMQITDVNTNPANANGTISFPTDATAFIGNRLMDLNIPSSASDGGCRGDVPFTQRTNIWVGVAWRGKVLPSSGIQDQKTLIFRDDINGSGDVFSGQFNQEFGDWLWNALGTDGTNHFPTVVHTDVNVWHTIKLHIDNSNGGLRTCDIYADGSNSPSNHFSTNKDIGLRMSDISFGGTLNAGSGASRFQFGAIAISTTDPGWP